MFTVFAAIAGVGGSDRASISIRHVNRAWGMGTGWGRSEQDLGGRRTRRRTRGSSFRLTDAAMPWWRGCRPHVRGDRAGDAGFRGPVIGLALPTMPSIEDLLRGHEGHRGYSSPRMIADGLAARVGGSFGTVRRHHPRPRGVLVPPPSAASAWTASCAGWQTSRLQSYCSMFQRHESIRIRHVDLGLPPHLLRPGIIFPLDRAAAHAGRDRRRHGRLALGAACFGRSAAPTDAAAASCGPAQSMHRLASRGAATTWAWRR